MTFAEACERAAAQFDAVVDASIDALSAIGLASLSATTRFVDRTTKLRSEFEPFGSGAARGIRAPTFYAGFLEYGTTRITPRPFMGDALRAIEAGGGAVIEREIGRVL